MSNDPILTALAVLGTKLGEGIDRLDARISDLDDRVTDGFDRADKRFDAIEGRFGQVEAAQTKLRVDLIARMDRPEVALRLVRDDLADIVARLARLERMLAAHDGLAKLEAKVDRIAAALKGPSPGSAI
jgi:hypothetical protein